MLSLVCELVNHLAPCHLGGCRLAPVFAGRLPDVAAPTKPLEVVERPRVAAPVEGLDVVHLVCVPSATSAPPVRGVEDLLANPRPSAGGEAAVVSAYVTTSPVALSTRSNHLGDSETRPTQRPDISPEGFISAMGWDFPQVSSRHSTT